MLFHLNALDVNKLGKTEINNVGSSIHLKMFCFCSFLHLFEFLGNALVTLHKMNKNRFLKMLIGFSMYF